MRQVSARSCRPCSTPVPWESSARRCLKKPCPGPPVGRSGWQTRHLGGRSPLPRRLSRTASRAHAHLDHVLRKVGFAAPHAAPPAHRPDHTGGQKLGSSTCSRLLPPSHAQGSGSSRSCPRGCDQTMSPAGLAFAAFGACARCAGVVRGLWLASRLGVLAARAARCASRCAASRAARFAPSSACAGLAACHEASRAGLSASVVIDARPRCPSPERDSLRRGATDAGIR